MNKIDYYIKAGEKDKHWYQLTENLFVELFGRERLHLVAKLFAATSINTSLPSNITLFRRALHELDNGLPFSNYLPNIKQQLEFIRDGKDLSGQKINAFYRAMTGDMDAVVVDVWLTRAFDIETRYARKQPNGSTRVRSGGVTAKNFKMVTENVQRIAHTLSLEPRQVSAMIWSGIRKTIGRNHNTRYHEILKFKLYNMYE